MRHTLIIALCLLLSSLTLSAQENPSAGYHELQELMTNARGMHPDTVLKKVDLLIAQLDRENEAQEARLFKARFMTDFGMFQEADSILSALLPWFRESDAYLSLLQLYATKGEILRTTGLLADGLQLMEEAEGFVNQQSNELTDTKEQIQIGRIYRVTGILYAMQIGLDEQGTYNQESAEKYFRQSHAVFSKAGDHVMEGLALFNIGNVQASEDSTMFYWQRALEVFDEHGFEDEKFNIYQNLAILHIDKGEFLIALEYLEETKRLMPANVTPFDLALYEVKLGSTYGQLSRLDEAVTHLEEALRLGLEYEMLSIQGEAYEQLIEVYSLQKRFEKALETYVRYDSLNKEFEQIETERIFRETEARYKTKEQQDQIQLLQQEEALNRARINRQRLIIAIIIICLLLIAALGFLFWKQSKSRQLMNQQLQKLDQARKRFLVNISHELRTPVTLIHAPLQDAMTSLEKEDVIRAKNDLKKISNSTKKLLQLTEEVLDISRLDEDALQLELASTDLDRFLNRVFFAFDSLAVRHQIGWNIDLALDSGFYAVDRKKLERVLNNLFSNAIKHTPKKGEVIFKARMSDGHLRLSITDTGRGMPQEALPRIFDRYYQASDNDKAMGGLGIGLALVKELVEFMNGTIEVSSQLGEGTTFSISLPLQRTEESPRAEESPEPNTLNVESRPSIDLSDKKASHILVVEDNPEMSDFIQQLLSDDYRVTLAENGKEGLDRLRSGKFDLITADVMMPEMDGISFVKEIKQHQDWKNISVIMITALSGEADKVDGLRLGIDDYIPKPFSANELKARVTNLIQNATARKEVTTEKEEEIVGNEKQLLDVAREKVEEHIGDNSFSVTELSAHLNLSERQANRVLKKITGLSCLQFIREIRLQRAYRLLESRKYQTIAEVAYAVGFENASYFTRIFNERFGKKPSEML